MPLERAREAYAMQAWSLARDSFAEADAQSPLGADDLEHIARSAYMLGLDDEYVTLLERAHHAHVAAGAVDAAVRCAWWIGHSCLFRGDGPRASGWFARGERLLEGREECLEHGYLLIPAWLQQIGSGDPETGRATAARAEAIGERFGDADLVWLARDDQARALMQLGRVDEALRLVDEALVTVTSGELSPIVTGIVFCNTIVFCRDAYEIRHVQLWVDSLRQWCDKQPQMVAHAGLCSVHRAEVMVLQGAFDAAIAEIDVVMSRFSLGVLNSFMIGKAHYCAGEVHRLRGDFASAEASYREASRSGYEPQPGLALLRNAQGKLSAAAAAIRRAVGERAAPLERAALLPAYIEIVLTQGEVDHARAACAELDRIAAERPNDILTALSAQCRGAVALVSGDAAVALPELRRALATWIDLSARYEAARARELIALSCRAVGDEDSASLELDLARSGFSELGARPDGARIETLIGQPAADEDFGLTAREVEVLRLVASGQTNRGIAEQLVISEHTVARHIQNTFVKLGVSSRTAASAVAHARQLV